MRQITQTQAVELLKKYANSHEQFLKVYRHSKKVQEIALRIGKKIKGADIGFIKIASLLHDIGRFECPPGKKTICHGIKGGEILKKEGFDHRFIRVCERHLGSGISAVDIKVQKLDIPLRDYLPETIEEKIITYADNLVFGDREGSDKEVFKRYREEIGLSAEEQAKKLRDSVVDLIDPK
jgi:uncharacterized protein (TIGR00295 family)